MDRIIEEIKQERQRQDGKWGVQNHAPVFWAVILGEEYGEVCTVGAVKAQAETEA